MPEKQLGLTKAEVSSTTAVAPSALLQAAIDKDLDVEKLERLIELDKQVRADKAKSTFLAAFAQFQDIVPDLGKDQKVSFGQGKTSYKFASLPGITRKIKEPLRECGLSYRFEIADKGDELSVKCVVSHTDGHSEETSMSAPADSSGSKNAIQARGSTVSYLQRYTLLGALGLVTGDTDNDGNAPKELISEKQESTLREWLDNSTADEGKFLQWLGVKKLEDVPAEMFKEAITALQKKAKS